MGFADDMKDYDEAWLSKQATDGRLPDGQYQAVITESRIEKDDQDRWTWFTRFQDRGGAGSVRKWQRLEDEKGREIAAIDAKRMGYEGPLSGLADWLAAENAIGLIMNIKVVTKAGAERDYTNVYVNSCIGKDNSTQATDSRQPTGPLPDDDDIPF